MLKHLKIGASALALSAFVLAPVATVVTADMAVAKSENAGGNGNGNGGGGGNGGGKGAGKSGDKGAKGNGGKKAKGGKSSAHKYDRTIQDDFKDFKKHGFKGLFGKNKPNKTKSAAASAPKANKGVSKKDDPMHASFWGKANGWRNSSEQSKLAHMANGNLDGKGPISIAAAYMVAKYEYGVDLEAYNNALGVVELADAFDLAADDPTTQRDLLASIETDGVEGLSDDEIQAAIDGGLISDAGEVTAAQEAIDAYDAAVASTDGQVNPYEDPEVDVEAARATVEEGMPDDADLVAAQESLLSTIKGDLSQFDVEEVEEAMAETTEETDMMEEEDETPSYLEGLNPVEIEILEYADSITPSDEEIKAALDKYDAKMADEEPPVDGDSAELEDGEEIIDES